MRYIFIIQKCTRLQEGTGTKRMNKSGIQVIVPLTSLIFAFLCILVLILFYFVFLLFLLLPLFLLSFSSLQIGFLCLEKEGGSCPTAPVNISSKLT